MPTNLPLPDIPDLDTGGVVPQGLMLPGASTRLPIAGAEAPEPMTLPGVGAAPQASPVTPAAATGPSMAERFTSAAAGFADALSVAGGGKAGYSEIILKNIKRRQDEEERVRKAALDERKFQLETIKTISEMDHKAYTQFTGGLAAVGSFAKNAPAATPEEKRVLVERGVRFGIPAELSNAMLRDPALGGRISELASFLDDADPSQSGALTAILRSMVRNGGEEKALAFVEQQGAGPVSQRIARAAPGVIAVLRETPGFDKLDTQAKFRLLTRHLEAIPGSGGAMASFLRGEWTAAESAKSLRPAVLDNVIPADMRPDIAAEAAKAGATRTATAEAEADVAGRPGTIAAAATKAGAVEREQQLARNTPEVAAVRAAAEARVEEAKKRVEIKYRGTGPLTPEQVGALRDDYTKASTPFVAIRDAYARMEDAAPRATAGSAAADITILYSYIKILDPTSVVREGEIALSQQAQGVPDQVLNLYNRLVQGKVTLGPEQRKNFLAEGRGAFRTQLQSQLAMEADFKRIARTRQADPDEAVPPSVIGRFRSFKGEQERQTGQSKESPDEAARRAYGLGKRK